LTKLGIYLVLKRIWNPIDFQCQRSRSLSQIFRQGDTLRFALPLFNDEVHFIHVCKKKNIEQWLPISLWQDYLPWIYLQNKTHFMNTFYCNFPTKLYMYVFWHWVNDNKWTYHLFDDKLSSAISFWLQNCYAWCDIFIDWGNYILVV
jgi:hypothetical protein